MKIKQMTHMKSKTTFKIGGKARYFAEPKTPDDYKQAINFAKEKRIPVIFLGGGANTLFPDSIIESLVISTRKFRKFTIDKERVVLGAGWLVDKAARMLAHRGLSGMEFAGGLPGSIGGAVYMNARCYGSEFADIVSAVTILKENGEMEILEKNKLDYAYKQSVFMKHPNWCVFSVEFALKKADKKSIWAVYHTNYLDRKNKGQFAYPSAGCAFKNDYSLGVSAGKIIDECGLKGKYIGGAEVYTKHANFIINKQNASSEDVRTLIAFVAEEVQRQKQVSLEKELCIIK